MKAWRSLRRVALLIAALTGLAGAHTAVTSVSPAHLSAVAAPRAVTLTFNEAVNLRFATVKVYPLALPAGAGALNVNRAAAELARTALPARADEARRADTAPRLSGHAARLSVPLRAPLKPGWYVLMWRLASEDGHPVSGQSAFRVK